MSGGSFQSMQLLWAQFHEYITLRGGLSPPARPLLAKGAVPSSFCPHGALFMEDLPWFHCWSENVDSCFFFWRLGKMEVIFFFVDQSDWITQIESNSKKLNYHPIDWTQLIWIQKVIYKLFTLYATQHNFSLSLLKVTISID